MPARPKLATKEAAEVRFPTWDELAEEATIDLPPYQLPLPARYDEKGKEIEAAMVIEIPVLDAEQYISVVSAQRVGSAVGVFEALFPDVITRGTVRRHLKGVHFPIMDVIATKVVRYFYGLSIEKQVDEGNSSAS